MIITDYSIADYGVQELFVSIMVHCLLSDSLVYLG